MKGTIYSIEGKVLRQINLPLFFMVSPRQDLVKRAVLSDESRTYQPKGSYKYAGLETSARYRGRKEDYGAVKNMGIPHLPHEVLPGGQLGKVKRVPHAVKGRRAHPPKPEKRLVEEINKKEYLKALECAVAATADRKIVSSRYREEVSPALPIIMDNAFESLKKTREVARVFSLLNLSVFIERAGKNNTKAPLVVVSKEVPLLKAGRNLAGVDIVTAEKLTVKHLAPGTMHGRVTLYTEDALAELHKRLKSVEPVAEKTHRKRRRPRNRMGVKSKKRKKAAGRKKSKKGDNR